MLRAAKDGSVKVFIAVSIVVFQLRTHAQVLAIVLKRKA